MSRFTSLLIWLCVPSSLAREIVVDQNQPPDPPNRFATIQEAIAAAVEGDTVLVQPGRYVGPVAINVAITVRSTDPSDPESTSIFGGNSVSAELSDGELQGFWLTQSWGPVLITGSGTVRDCLITKEVTNVGGVVIEDDGRLIDSSVFDIRGVGVSAADRAQVQGCEVSGGQIGLTAVGDAVVSNSVLGNGVSLSDRAALLDSTIPRGASIQAVDDTVVRGCVINNAGVALWGRAALLNSIITGARIDIHEDSQVQNCVLRDSGQLMASGRAIVSHCTIWRPKSPAVSVSGTSTVANCIITSDQVTDKGKIGLVIVGGTPRITYNCIWDMDVDPRTATEHSVLADPRLAADGFHLLPDSPCIDAGDPAFTPTEGDTDIDGLPRVVGSRVDIGADEFLFAGDLDFDGNVNREDLTKLFRCAIPACNPGPDECSRADLTGDGSIDCDDWSSLVGELENRSDASQECPFLGDSQPPCLVESRPQDGFIDPRNETGGIDEITFTFNEMVFNVDGSPISIETFRIDTTENEQLGGLHVIPVPIAVDATANPMVVVTLSRPIPVGEWTTITARVQSADGVAAFPSIRIGHLPCDVNQDGEVTVSDVSAYSIEWRKIPQQRELLDTNRDGQISASDPLAFGASFSGFLGFQEWSGLSLPERLR